MLQFSSRQFSLLKKYFSTSKDVFLAQCLKERSLLQLSGKDASSYLQGLITNDMAHLQGGQPSIFTMFLNSKGRVLYDSIIYNSKKENVYYIECDKKASSSLRDHLLMYKVRRKVNVDFLEDDLEIWTFVNNENFINVTHTSDYKPILDSVQKNLVNVVAVIDPRLPALGLRIISPKNSNIGKEIGEKIGVKVQEENFYKMYRYKLGIGEGLQELPIEKCFPMEINGDYLHGISFQKGCYIGQELTARTYHTGVIRKRLMPLIFQEEIKMSEQGIPIFPVPQSNKSVGKLQGVEQNTGVGLLRIDEALKADELMVLNTKCKTQRPFWWPQSASTEKLVMEERQTKDKVVEEEQTSEKVVREEQTSEKVEEEEVKWFECSICKLREAYDIKTYKPKFTPFITFNDESYIVKDPFTPAEKKQFFVLGSDCNVCKKPVCQSNDCSIFYKKRYCQHCANTRKKVLPEQLHSKIKSIV